MKANYYGERPWLKHYSPWAPPDLEIPKENLVEVLQRHARHGGSKPALYYFGCSLSFSDLDRWSDILCAALQFLGLKKGDRVVFYLQNIPQFVIAQYAVWKAGAIVVPLNPMYKEKELEYFFLDSGARMLITLCSAYESTARNVVARMNLGPVVSTSATDFLPAKEPLPKGLQEESRQKYPHTYDFLDLLEEFKDKTPENSLLSNQEPAYFTYTAGTTGPPKGALNTHGNIVFNALFYSTSLGLKEGDVILGVSPLFHVTGQVAHLAAGAYAGIPVILFFRFDPEEALRLIELRKATTTLGSTTAFISLLRHPDIGKRDLSSFRKVYTGGAPVPAQVVEDFEKRTGIYIHHAYGLTETSSPCHFTPLGKRAPVDPETGALSIGVPICNALAKIVDLETGETELSPGELGEIAIKGPMVVPGYWKNPPETAHAIRNGWLYTGDVGKMDESGWFYAVDRKKDLIIVSGYKVWPREVEDVICQHPAVKEASVIGIPDPYRGETVKAFVVIKDAFKDRIAAEEMIEFCRNRMAAYKYPRVIEIVSEIPKTPTGKYLRRALREQERKKRPR